MLTTSTPARASSAIQPPIVMAAAAAFGHLHVLRIGAAEQHHQPAVPRDRRPRRERAGHRLRASRGRAAETSAPCRSCSWRPGRRSRRRSTGSGAVCVRASWKMPAEPQPCEPPMMALVAVLALDARKLAGDQIERALPRHRHERLAAAAFAAARAPRFSQPSRTIGRAMRVGECTASGIASIMRRGIGVAVERPHADDAAVFDLGEKGAPVGMVANELGHGLLCGDLSRTLSRCVRCVALIAAVGPNLISAFSPTSGASCTNIHCGVDRLSFGWRGSGYWQRATHEMRQHCVGDKSRALGIDVTVTGASLAMCEEALGHHQVQLILSSRHGHV